MTIDQLEKAIIDNLRTNSNVDWDMAEISPNEEFEYLIKDVKDLFKQFRKEKIKWKYK